MASNIIEILPQAIMNREAKVKNTYFNDYVNMFLLNDSNIFLMLKLFTM